MDDIESGVAYFFFVQPSVTLNESALARTHVSACFERKIVFYIHFISKCTRHAFFPLEPRGRCNGPLKRV